MQTNTKNYWDRRKIRSVIFYLYFILLTWLLLRAGNEKIKLPGFFYYNDKVSHVLAFLVLTASGMIAFSRVRKWIIIILFIFYGIAIEFLQELMNLGRTFEYLDILADIAGSILGFLVVQFIIKKKLRI